MHIQITRPFPFKGKVINASIRFDKCVDLTHLEGSSVSAYEVGERYVFLVKDALLNVVNTPVVFKGQVFVHLVEAFIRRETKKFTPQLASISE